MKLKREVKVIIVIVSIVLIAGLIGTCVLLNKKEELNEPTIGINTEEVSTTTEAVIEEEKEEQPTNEVDETKPEQTKPTTTQKTTVSTSKKVSQTKANSTKQTQTTQKKTVVTTEPTTKVTTQSSAKRTCTNSDAGWQQKISKWNNQGYMVFTSRSEAEAYANYAMNIGYGYWINQAIYPEKYEDESCRMEFHVVSLYMPAGVCTAPDGSVTKKFNLPATPKDKLIGKIDYLVSKGYDCSGRKDPLSGNIY